jgi:hypothetical protein
MISARTGADSASDALPRILLRKPSPLARGRGLGANVRARFRAGAGWLNIAHS